MKKFVCLSFLFFATSVFAQHNLGGNGQEGRVKTCCVCMTDAWPQKHVKWYRKGCNMWLGDQKGCNSKAVISKSEHSVSGEFKTATRSCRNGQIKLGYVGHWGSARQSANFVDNVLVPLRNDLGANISFENTACSGLDDPDFLQQHVEKVSEGSRNHIRIGGNQCISTGMWDGMLPGKHNFRAEWAQTSLRLSSLLARNMRTADAGAGIKLENMASV